MGGPEKPSSSTSRNKWLFISFTLPARPSRARVHAWRQLKKLGAVNYQSVWVVPYSRDKAAALESLLKDIEAANGNGVLVEGRLLRPADEEGIKQALLAAGNEEYGEIIEKCDDFLNEIAMEIARENFIFAELEENEEDFDKLRKWLRKVEKRSSLESPLHKEALGKMKLCEKAMNEFAQIVFEHTQGKRD